MKKLIVVAIAAIAMFASSAYAADWNFYGSARMWTFSSDVETNGGASNRDTNWELSPYSRIGANVKVSDELTGRFEYGVMTAAADESVRLRLLYGKWNFGAGALTVGQDYSPIFIAPSNQGYAGDGMGGMGDNYRGRTPQIKVEFGEFQFALLSPVATAINQLAVAPAVSADTVETTLPKIEARYTYRFDNGNVRAVAGYNSFEQDFGTFQDDVNSYVFGFGADFNFGALRLAGSFTVGENSGSLIAVESSDDTYVTGGSGNAGAALENAAGTQILDNEVVGFQVVIGYTINDMIALEAGYGWIEEDIDTLDSSDAQTYYLQAPITMAPGVTVTPEIGVYDYNEPTAVAGTETDQITYFGVKWQINF